MQAKTATQIKKGDMLVWFLYPIAMVLYAVMILAIFAPLESRAGTCTSISRTNNSANAVLTSAKYNADLNTSYTNQNAYDGGCVTDGTIEFAALNASEFGAQTSAIREGCKVTRSDANTLSVDKCYMTIDGANMQTTSANTVTWGCTSCSSESASTTYYLYVKTGSTGTTMNLLISTTAPNGDGYDASSNRILARFYNDSSSDIDQYSIDQWVVNDFYPTNSNWVAYTPTFTGFGTVTVSYFRWKRDGDSIIIDGTFTPGTTTAVEAQITFPSAKTYNTALHTFPSNNVRTGHYFKGVTATVHGGVVIMNDTLTTGMKFSNTGIFGATNVDALTSANGDAVANAGEEVSLLMSIPILGWSN
jgi:hypothetical protein